MRSLNLLLRLAVVFIVLLSLSCKKRGHFEVPCKIEKIISNYHFYPEDPFEVNISTFAHNAWGDPVSIIQSVPTTGRPHYYFYYDNSHRLTSFKAEYGNGNIEYYTRYFYNNNHFIVRDTTWYAGSDVNNPASFYQTFVNEYSYDSKGRVSKVAFKVLGIPASAHETTYSYDAQGNLVRPGVTYDNKTSYLRTSLVLAFVTRDYSMNNYSTALNYNTKGLPTAFPTDWRNQNIPHFFNTQISEIEYTCDDHDND